MTREELIRIAQEVAILVSYDRHQDAATKLEHLAKRIAAAEREECAKLCEAHEDDLREWDIQQQCANAIRARGDA